MKFKTNYPCLSRQFYNRNFINCIPIYVFILLCTPNAVASSPFSFVHHKGQFARFLLNFAHIQDTDFCPFSFYLKKPPTPQYHQHYQQSLYWQLNSEINENRGNEKEDRKNFTNSNPDQPLISFIHEAEGFSVKRNKNKTKRSTEPSFDLWDGKRIHKLTVQCNTFIYPLKIKWSPNESKTKSQKKKVAQLVNSLVSDIFNLGNLARDRFIIFVNYKEESLFREVLENLPGRKIRFLIGVLLDEDGREMRESNNLGLSRMSLSTVNLNGIHFRMSAVTIPPLIMQRNGQIYDGMMRSLYMAAAANFNYTYETTEEKEGTGRKLPNGTWIGSLADLKKERYDMAAVIRMSGQRQGHIDITNYLWNDQPVFLVALPQAYIPLTALIGPFTSGVWSLILVSFILVASILFVSTTMQKYESQEEDQRNICKKHPRPLSTSERLYLSILTPFALFLDQGVDAVDRTRLKSIIAFWMFLALVLGVGYKDKLFAFLTFPQEEIIPRDLLELHQRTDYQVNMYYWKSALFNMLNSSEYPIHQTLVKRLDLIPNNVKCVLSAILTPKTACIAVKSLLEITMASNATISHGFEAGVISERILNMDPMTISIGLQKNSIFTETWNIVSAMFRDTGIFSKWEMDTFADFRRKGKSWLQGQSDDNQVKMTMKGLYLKYNTRVKPLELSNFYAILGVYMVSVVFCLLVFVCENNPWANKKVNDHKKMMKLPQLNPKMRWKHVKTIVQGIMLPTGSRNRTLNADVENKLSPPSSHSSRTNRLDTSVSVQLDEQIGNK